MKPYFTLFKIGSLLAGVGVGMLLNQSLAAGLIAAGTLVMVCAAAEAIREKIK